MAKSSDTFYILWYYNDCAFNFVATVWRMPFSSFSMIMPPCKRHEIRSWCKDYLTFSVFEHFQLNTFCILKCWLEKTKQFHSSVYLFFTYQWTVMMHTSMSFISKSKNVYILCFAGGILNDSVHFVDLLFWCSIKYSVEHFLSFALF